MGDSVKRQQMVFAGAVELDVFDDHGSSCPTSNTVVKTSSDLVATHRTSLRSFVPHAPGFAQSITVGVFPWRSAIDDRGGNGVSVTLCRGTGVGAHWIDGHASIY